MTQSNQWRERRDVLKYVASSVGIAGLAGCAGGGGSGQQGQTTQSGDGGGATTASGGGADSGSGSGGSGKLRQITALGGITGGSGYQQCLVFQQIVHQQMPNVRVTVSGTSGWKTDAKLMWKRGADAGQFGIVPAGDAYNILHGNDPYAEENNYVVQAYPAVPPGYLHIAVPQNSNIQSYADLSGKRINILSRGSLTNSVTPQVLDSIGVKPAKYFHYPHQEAASALTRGDIDAVAASGSAAPYMELSQNTKLRVLSVNDSQQKSMSDAVPWLGFATVDFGQWYQGAGEATVPAPWTVMGTLLSVDEDFVYEVTKSIFNNIDLAKQIYEPASQLTPDKAPDTQVPVHPGAYRFYEEQGVSFPDELKPPKKGDLPLGN